MFNQCLPLMKTVTRKSSRTLAIIFYFSFFIFQFPLSYSQVPTVQDCLGAIPICQDVYTELNSYSGSGHYPNEIYNSNGDCTQDCPGSCLDGEQNSVWYIFTVQTGGLLRMTIDPAIDNDDYDWAVYELSEYRCSDIYDHYPEMQRSCNAYGSTTNNGPTGISTPDGGTTNCNHCGEAGSSKWNLDLPVTTGKTYVLIVENWGSPEGGYTLDFSASTADIYDNVPPALDTVLTDNITCGTTNIIVDFSENVKCSSVDPADFQFTGPGGPYNIMDVQGQTCLIGGTMEKQYKLFLDPPLTSNGEYSLMLVAGNDVYDGCNNIAGPDTIVLSLDLGAPLVIDTGIVITPADYGVNNGQITGLIVNGNEPLSYRWYDHNSDTVGTGLELHDVYSGNYYLEVTDTNGCKTNAGPYFVDLAENISDAKKNHPGTISIYPNPNTGIFTIQVSKNVTGIKIFNMMGEIIEVYGKEKIIGGTIRADLRQHGRGIYMIRAASDNGIYFSQRVLVF